MSSIHEHCSGAVEEFGLDDTWKRELTCTPKGVFDMLRLLNAATQPLPMDALCCHSTSRHSAQSGVDMFRLLYAAVQPASFYSDVLEYESYMPTNGYT